MHNRLWGLINRYARSFFSVSVIFLLFQIGDVNLASAGEVMAPGPYKAPLKYALKLPKYCGGLYFQRKEPEYRMPPRELCGVGTNHFCSGLIALYKAREEPNPKKKSGYYRKAKNEVEYTKHWISDYPKCPLHPIVNRTLMEIDGMLMIYK